MGITGIIYLDERKDNAMEETEIDWKEAFFVLALLVQRIEREPIDSTGDPLLRANRYIEMIISTPRVKKG